MSRIKRMRASQWLSLLAVLLALAYVAGVAWGTWRHTNLTTSLISRLESGQSRSDSRTVRSDEFDLLPPVVQRYLKAVLPDNAPRLTGATLMQTGTFNMSESANQWKPFTARHRVLTQPPGFVWDARIAVFPGLQAMVHDAYVSGEGLLRPTLAGIWTLLELRGPGDIAEGELMRFLAEAPWYPTVLAPGQGVVWKPVSEQEADATLTDGGVSVTLRFRFNGEGLIESVRSEGRSRTVAGQIVRTPWEGRWSNYQVRENMRVPMTGEVAWLLPEGRKPYWRGTLYSIEYQPAR